MLVPVFEVALQQVRDVEAVGAAALAGVAVDAVLDLMHLLVELLGEVDRIGGAAQEEVHTVAALDFDAHGARLAVAATTAEIASQFAAVLLDALAHLVVELGRIALERDKLVQLAFALYAPDRLHIGKLGQVGVCRGGVVDKSACKGFHTDEADVLLGTLVDERQLLVRSQVGEGKLQRLVQAAVDGLLGHSQAVVGDAYVAHLALLLCLEHSLVQACAVARQGAESGVVELVEVDIVSAQQAQRRFEVLPEAFCGGGTRLGADNHLVATVVEGVAQFLLAVCIETGSVEIVHTVIESLVDQSYGFFL